jgi:hypothetical protein
MNRVYFDFRLICGNGTSQWFAIVPSCIVSLAVVIYIKYDLCIVVMYEYYCINTTKHDNHMCCRLSARRERNAPTLVLHGMGSWPHGNGKEVEGVPCPPKQPRLSSRSVILSGATSAGNLGRAFWASTSTTRK